MSYTTEYATSALSSRASASPASWTTLVEAQPLALDDELPRFVLHDPVGQRHAIRTQSALHVLGAFTLTDTTLRGRAHVCEWGAILGGSERRWDGLTFDGYENYQERSPRFDTRLTIGGHQLASRIVGAQWTSVVQEHASLRETPSVRIISVLGKSRWTDVVDGSGVAAIDEQGGVIAAFTDGRVLLYAPDGESRAGQLDEGVTHISAIGDGGVALTVRAGETRVRSIRVNGEVAWEARVPFEAAQPAIDGNGRVYIVGAGLAAIEQGRVLWATPAPTQLHATAFGDGSLAVCAETQLQLVATHGGITRTAVTPIAAQLLTPPAIDPAGNVWVASSDRLWVTR